MLIWAMSFIPSTILIDPAYGGLLRIIQVIGSVSGAFFASTMVFWINIVHESRLTLLFTLFAIFFIGALCFLALLPESWILVPSSSGGWDVVWTGAFPLSLAGFVASIAMIILNYCIRLALALRKLKSSTYRITAPVVIASLCFLLLGGTLLVISRGTLIGEIIPRLSFIIPMIIGLIGFSMAHWFNPMVGILVSPPLHSLLILDLRNNLPLFIFDFKKGVTQEETELELLSAILGVMRMAIGEITGSLHSIRSISTAFGELMIEENGPIASFLVTDGEVHVSRESLKHITESFYHRYQEMILSGKTHELNKFRDFTDAVRRFFGFAF